jgi:small subunit ribosomal protein S5
VVKKVRDNKNADKREAKEFDEEILELARVTRVVKGGRRLRFRVTVAIGDRKGRVGIGIGKSAEVAASVQKAVAQAKKALITVPLTDISSIPHDVRIKFKAAQIYAFPAVEGTGIKAGGVVRKIFDLAGIKNVIAKRFGTTNPLVNAQATMMILKELR